ncbi:putative multicatalytic endopeptidase complex chain PRE1 [Jaminaea rosea]|uniref:Proteasome subunit beta n=1 Tax=Jaminaea rosea TaxID=1569628 RepID=A0A316UPE0_9BASI|nr:putative multicatalytic endopeptidase complex chain PRE1 [Jaminaea rosea]PWN26211.1 putative multicatalytic endopeptidase complex chain PRE1 [Jaminaea rosea]
MECQFGITGKGYTILASDQNAARSIVKMKGDQDKIMELTQHLAMAYNGESGDTTNFAEYIEANLKLYAIRHHIQLRPRAASAWIRTELANSLRSRHPYQVNLILGGYDLPTSTPALYWVDYLGTLAQVPYAAHGYGAFFCLSTLDRYHRPDMELDEGLELLKRCINELKTRFIVDLGTWKVKVVDRDGTREVTL